MMSRIFALLCSSGLAAGLLVTTARLSRRRARHCAALLSGGFDRGCGAGTVESPRVARDSAWAAAVAEVWRADEDINASLTRGDTHRREPATYLDEDGVAFHGELVWAEGRGFGQVRPCIAVRLEQVLDGTAMHSWAALGNCCSV